MLHKDDGICLLLCSDSALCLCLLLSGLRSRTRAKSSRAGNVHLSLNSTSSWGNVVARAPCGQIELPLRCLWSQNLLPLPWDIAEKKKKKKYKIVRDSVTGSTCSIAVRGGFDAPYNMSRKVKIPKPVVFFCKILRCSCYLAALENIVSNSHLGR